MPSVSADLNDRCRRCNATALLDRIELRAVLPQMFGRVLISPAVAAELRHASALEAIRNWMSSLPEWLEIQVPRAADPALKNLGVGEREAIELALEVHADWLIVDDAEGRNAATQRNIPTLGTLRVLDEAAGRGWIDIRVVVKPLRNTSFHVSPKLLEWLLSRH